MLGKGLQQKTTALLVFCLCSVKSLKNLRIIGLLITWRNVTYFLISNMVLGLLDQLQIFQQLYLIELLWPLTNLGAIQAVALDISKASERAWHAGLLHKLRSYANLGQIFSLILSFLSNTLLQMVWMKILQKNIQLMLEFFKVPFFAQHFCCYTLMIFLMILSVILLSMPLSTLSEIRHLPCSNN